MLTQQEFQWARKKTLDTLRRLSVTVTAQEAEQIEVADFGLGQLEIFGLQLLVYVNTERVCAKELVLFPGQICPEHYHPAVSGELGKEETFRCRAGEVYLYVPGDPTPVSKATIPMGCEKYLTARHEVLLRAGEQYTIYPETHHWFQAGAAGAVVSEFSTRSRDEYDVFTDPRVIRQPQIAYS